MLHGFHLPPSRFVSLISITVTSLSIALLYSRVLSVGYENTGSRIWALSENS